MVTPESLHERYAVMETEALLEIYVNKADYTELAISVVDKELKKRKIPREEVINYKSVIPRGNSPLTLENYLTDLKLWQKVVFFIFWLPHIRNYFRAKFQPEGYFLKAVQSNYYSIIGFIIFVISVPFGRNDFSEFFIALIAGFLLTYAFDIGYYRTRQMDDLSKRVSEGEILE